MNITTTNTINLLKDAARRQRNDKAFQTALESYRERLARDKAYKLLKQMEKEEDGYWDDFSGEA